MREVEPAAWDGLLAELGHGDAYLQRAYVECACVLDPGKPLLFEHEGTVLACILRPLTVTVTVKSGHDVVTPYGYGGPVGGDAAAFWRDYEAWCAERGVLTTFVRFHPRFANQRGARVHVEQLASTIGWRVQSDDLLACMHSKHRNVVRKAEAAGVSVEGSHGLGDFVPLYEETMQRAGAQAFYFFSGDYWEALARLGEGLVRFDARHEGETVASALCLASPPWLHYHLGAASEAGRTLGATTLLLYEAARWARDRGYERFHLGGGLGGKRDSLHEFKRRFDPGGELEAAIGKAVHDPVAYRAAGGDPDDLSGFFPAYRRPT